MTDTLDFNIKESTLEKMLLLKKNDGYDKKGWDEWFDYRFRNNHVQKSIQNEIEETMEKLHYESYDQWITNFALNLSSIWNESSARELDPTKVLIPDEKKQTAIVIGRGPSVKKHRHLELIANSDYNGSIVCCDGALINVLQAGITPEKFPNFYVVTIDPYDVVKKYYDDKIVDKYGSKIKGIFSTIVKPNTVERARQAGIKVHWLHSLFDYNEGKKSFNHISALVVRARNHIHGLPAIQTGGNVGTSAWFVSWQILKCSTVVLVGINHGWEEDDPLELILAHGRTNLPLDVDKSSITFQKLFPKIYNPEFNCNCILDPLFQFYSAALKEFISRSPSWVTTINATEGGSIFGPRIKCITLERFLKNYHH